ncbi:MAG: hypothetical protein ABID38_05395 [Candidatus Diapherotrites archaeon]
MESGKIFSAIFALLVLLTLITPTSALISDGYIHKEQYYAVSFDGEGDAVVRAQIVIENTTDEPIEELSFEIPNQVVVYKLVQEQPGAERISYEKELTSNATILKMDLPNKIPAYGSSTITLFYKISKSATQNMLGNWDIDFKTIVDKDAALVEYVRVAVNVQEGLNLKGGSAEVDYKTDFLDVGGMQKLSVASEASYEYKQYSDSIRNTKGLVKTAQNLDPWESFHVRGEYSKSILALFWLEIVLAVIVLLLVVLAALKIVGRALAKGNKTGSGKIDSGKKQAVTKINPYIKMAGIGFAVSLALILFWIGAFILLVLLDSMISYSVMGLIVMLTLFLGLLVSLALGFGVPVYLAAKNGIKEGAIAGAAIFIGLIIISIIFLIVVGVFF